MAEIFWPELTLTEAFFFKSKYFRFLNQLFENLNGFFERKAFHMKTEINYTIVSKKILKPNSN